MDTRQIFIFHISYSNTTRTKFYYYYPKLLIFHYSQDDYIIWYLKDVWSDYHNTPDILQFLTSFCNYVFTWKQFLSIKVLVNIQHAKLSTVGIYDMKEAKNLLIHRKYHTSKIPKEIKNAFHAKIHINLTYDVYVYGMIALLLTNKKITIQWIMNECISICKCYIMYRGYSISHVCNFFKFL